MNNDFSRRHLCPNPPVLAGGRLRAINKHTLTAVMKQFILQRSIEYNDNCISLFIAQYGKCTVTGIVLSFND